ncbi:MAG: hypothetical protein ISR64_04565 [Deltaproteobacteria bacterium]|nr:hypothetical protein [Deltaproteobacteria bacterium]
MFEKQRLKRAMKAADGEAPVKGADRAEVERVKAMSDLVKTAARADLQEVPPFDAMWSGVERQLNQARPPLAEEGEGWWQTLLGRNPIGVLAPAGAMLLAMVLGALWFLQHPVASNQCFVDSYDVESGAVLIDQDFDDPQRPTVIWYVEEG